ncbi:tesmin [Podargus strigoides]
MENQVICELEGGGKDVNVLFSDVDNSVTAVLGQFLPVPGEVVLNEQKGSLDKNPEAFLPKIGKKKLGEINPHCNKGCNSKCSGCLQNYCECFEAKIMCSSICKCISCKNYEESPDEKKQLNVLNHIDIGNNEGNSPVLTSAFKTLPNLKKNRGYSACLAERMILEEFGRCLSQILHA